jgi:hypothetical protein
MSRTTILIVIGLIAIFSESVYGEEARLADQLPPVPQGKTWKLVWHDEFDGTTLDIKKATLPDAFLVDYVRVYDVVEKK